MPVVEPRLAAETRPIGEEREFLHLMQRPFFNWYARELVRRELRRSLPAQPCAQVAEVGDQFGRRQPHRFLVDARADTTTSSFPAATRPGPEVTAKLGRS